ncbi:MAG: hypothetical protein IJ528_00440, partial [Bacteroidaceae bacterium]|nr:hypothetical protein [Bacteroidaceae bacterium]
IRLGVSPPPSHSPHQGEVSFGLSQILSSLTPYVGGCRDDKGVGDRFWMFFVYIRKLNYLLFIILFQYSLLKSGGFGLPYRFLLVSLQVEFITIND